MALKLIKTYCFLLFFYCLFLPNTQAQQYYTRNLTMRDGLPSNSVRAVFKSSDGYLWFGTDEGACRYDGNKISIFSTNDGISGSKVWSIAEDTDKNLWFGCYDNGITRYDGKNFKSFYPKNGLVQKNVRILKYSIKFSLLMIGTDDGVSFYDGENFYSFCQKNGTVDERLQVMDFIVSKDFIYIFTFTSGVYKYYPGSKKIMKASQQCNFNLSCNSSAYLTSQNDTIVGASKYGINVVTKDSFYIEKNIGQVFGITEDLNSNLWISAWSSGMTEPGGLFKYKKGHAENFTKKFAINTPLAWFTWFDRENELLWVTTNDKGVFMYPNSGFILYNAEYFGLKEMRVVDLSFDKNGNLWILSTDNLILKKQDGTFIIIDKKKFIDTYNNTCKGKKRFSEVFESFFDLYIDAKQNAWVSSGMGLFKVSPGSFKINAYGYCLQNIIFDKDGALYVSGWGNLSLFPNIEKNSDSINYDFKKHHTPVDVSKTIQRNDEIWFSSWAKGLFLAKNKKYTWFNDSLHSLPSGINDICFDKSGHIITGSNTGMVHILSYKQNHLKVEHVIDKNSGLIGNSVQWLLADSLNNLWVGTNTGLNRINLNRLFKDSKIEINIYNETEGYCALPGQNAVVDKSGNIWVCTNYGVLEIVPNSPRRQETPAKINLSNVEVNNKIDSNFNSNYDLSKKIDLEYWQNNISFFFTVFNFYNHDKDYYRYRLFGFDNQWSSLSKENRAIYTNLPAGSYTFIVESQNQNTLKWATPLILKFKIQPPFWKSLWFVVLTIGAIIFIVWFTIRLRIRRIKLNEKQKTEIARKIAEMEMKALQAQMNPHFTFNAMNSIQNYILDNNIDDALAYLGDFSKIIRKTLDNANKKRISLKDEIDYLKHYLRLEQMRFKNKFELSITIEPEIDETSVYLPLMIIQPYIENSIRHGFLNETKNGVLLIRFSKIKNLLVCTVEDNGIGRSRSKEFNNFKINKHQVHGTEITEDRVKLFNQSGENIYKIEIIDLLDSSGIASGTKVVITLPFIHEI